jgi:hypothetical protein
MVADKAGRKDLTNLPLLLLKLTARSSKEGIIAVVKKKVQYLVPRWGLK